MNESGIVDYVSGDALVGVAEIASRLGVRPNTVIVWRRRGLEFPSPLAALAMGPVWYWPDIDAWYQARHYVSRTGR